jgi:hypothetical protein
MRRIGGAFVGAACLLLTVPAVAKDAVVEADDIYLGAGVSYQWFQVPTLNSFANVIDTSGYLFISQPNLSLPDTVSGGAPKLFAGLNLGRVTPFGDTTRVEVGGTWFSQTGSNSSANTMPAGGFIDFLPVQGGSVNGGSSTSTYNTAVTTKIATDEAWATVATDFPSSWGVLTPSLGVVIGQIKTSYNITMTQPGVTPSYTLNEAVPVQYVGPRFGLKLAAPLMDRLTGSFGGEAAWLMASQNLNATQGGNAATGTGIFNNAYNTSRDRGMGRVGVSAAVDYQLLDPLTVSLGGSATWWLSMPTIINPSSSPGVTATTVTFPAARLVGRTIATYGVNLSATYHF